MRRVLHGDVVKAARALLAAPHCAREHLMGRMLDEADWADRYRKRFGRGHALFGDGSLQSSASKRLLKPEPVLHDPEYCRCMIVVFEALLARRVIHECR